MADDTVTLTRDEADAIVEYMDKSYSWHPALGLLLGSAPLASAHEKLTEPVTPATPSPSGG